MAQRSGRLSCPKCGANNFDTVTACWKCGAILSQGAAPMPMTPMAAPMSYNPERPQAPPPMMYAPPAITGDPNVAKRAAILLALTIPWIGLPLGWAFMMVEDHRKQAVGRLCATWSMIALLFHLVLMVWLTQASTAYLMKTLLPIAMNMSQKGGAGGPGGGLPGGGE